MTQAVCTVQLFHFRIWVVEILQVKMNLPPWKTEWICFPCALVGYESVPEIYSGSLCSSC